MNSVRAEASRGPWRAHTAPRRNPDSEGGSTARAAWESSGLVGTTAAICLASLVFIAPLAEGTTAASAGPPFHGLVVPSSGYSVSGCAKVRPLHPWSFGLRTGLARVSSGGVALGCPSSISGSGLPSTAESDGGLQVTIPLSGISSSTSTIVANLSWNASVALNSSDGYPSGPAAPCNSTATSYDSVTHEHDWLFNYSSYTYGATNVTARDRVNGGRPISLSFGPPTPTPFVRNGTTKSSYLHTYGAHRECLAESYANVGVSAYVYDQTTSTVLSPTGDTVDNSYGTIVSAYVQIENTTDWSCSVGSGWYGPANYSYKMPLSCTSQNVSTSSIAFAFFKHIHYSAGTNNIQPWNGSVGTSGAFWWNSSAAAPVFSATDRYVLQLSTSTILGASNGWWGGSSSWSLDLAAHGRGIHLRSIAIY